MRSTLPLFLLLSAVLPLGVRAADPSTVDASKTNTQLAPLPDNTPARLAPNNPGNQRTFWRNDQVQDQRFRTPDPIEHKDAPVGEKRARIEVKETREKNMVDRKDYPKPEVKDRVQNRHDGEKARIQPEGDQIKKYDPVARYQDRMADAKDAASQRAPKVEKRTTFDKLNRFVFQRNGLGTENGKPVVTTAGSGAVPASQDTYSKLQVKSVVK